MKRSHGNNQHTRPDGHRRHDEFDTLLHQFGTPTTAAASPAERWERLRKRINGYQQLQALIAHMSGHGPELRRATLLLRPWQSATLLIS